MAGQGDRTFLLGDMADNFVKWFILGQVIDERRSRFSRNARVSAISLSSETEQSGRKLAC
jgi:hypothetical protein